MTQELLSRRQFGTAAVALTTVGFAGCSDDETASEDDDETFDVDDPGDLTIYFENEDGEAVSNGIEVTIENEAEDFSTTQGSEIEDGELLASGLIYEGEYTVTAESTDDEFDAVEETVTLEEGVDEELTLTLEGATPDSEIDDEE
ncbi:S-layer protein [Natronococcus wangiae]|uniref:S-layer protein n=1 Tax=Natronococcus wangiae TaxID=3068275 RepID=UPI00273FE1E7|nr:S-layer protein [Natronococcus sp. AD5]